MQSSSDVSSYYRPMGLSTQGGDEATGRPLRDVYSVSLGVALVLAVEQIVDLERSGVSIRLVAALPFLAFIATAFSLYHWAVRFVDLSYSGEERRRPGAIVTSLFVGSTELIILIALSILISRPAVFLAGLVVVFAFEVVAGLALRATDAYVAAGDFARKYLLINGLALVCAALGMLVVSLGDADPVVAGAVALLASWGRAVAFYRVGFRLLF